MIEEAAVDFEGTGRFVHEPERRRLTVRWQRDRSAISVGDDERSMLPATRLEDLTIVTDGSGTYEISRHRGAVKPIEFTPDLPHAFEQVAPSSMQAGLSAAPLETIPEGAPPDTLRYVGATLTRWVAGLTFGAAALFGLSTLLYVGAGDDYADHLADPPGPEDPLTTAASADALYGLAWLVVLASGVVFLVWFYRAYQAADSRGPLRTRWSSGWTIGGWFIPFANLAIPKLVMNEVDRVSHPGNGDPPVGQAWQRQPRLITSDLWWAAWILASVAAIVETIMAGVDPDAVLPYAAGGAALLTAAGGLLGSVVLTIGGRLAEPRPRAWEGLGG